MGGWKEGVSEIVWYNNNRGAREIGGGWTNWKLSLSWLNTFIIMFTIISMFQELIGLQLNCLKIGKWRGMIIRYSKVLDVWQGTQAESLSKRNLNRYFINNCETELRFVQFPFTLFKGNSPFRNLGSLSTARNFLRIPRRAIFLMYWLHSPQTYGKFNWMLYQKIQYIFLCPTWQK